VGVFVTPCLGTNFQAAAVKKLPPLGPIFTAAPGSQGRCQSQGRGEERSCGLGKPLSPRRRALGAYGSDPTPPIWLQIRGGLKRPLGRLYGAVGGLLLIHYPPSRTCSPHVAAMSHAPCMSVLSLYTSLWSGRSEQPAARAAVRAVRSGPLVIVIRCHTIPNIDSLYVVMSPPHTPIPLYPYLYVV
jgi:hypothetical protein